MRAWYQSLRQSLNGIVLSVKDYGASGDGSVDDTAAFQAAISQAAVNHGVLYIPTGNYKITAELPITTALIIFGDGPTSSIIEPHLTAAVSNVFAMTAGGNLIVRDIGFDGSSVSNPTPTNMVYMINVDPSSGTLENVDITNVRFSNLNLFNGVYGTAADVDLRTTHCIFIDNVDYVSITKCVADTVAGSFCYIQYVNHITVKDNHLKDVGWYPIHFEARVRFFSVEDNFITHPTTTGSVLGGFIDILEDTTVLIGTSGTDPDGIFYNNGLIQGNYCSGRSAYASVINVLSVSGVTIKDNKIDSIARGTQNSTDGFIYNIHVGTRAASNFFYYGPPMNIIIEGNMIRSESNGGVLNYGIRVDNDFQSNIVGTERRLIERVIIRENIMGYHLYNRGSGYPDVNMDKGIYVTGDIGGMQDLTIEDNSILNRITTQASADGEGVIDIIGSSSTIVDGVKIGGNRIEMVGTPTGSSVVGISIGNYVENVLNTKPNYFLNPYTAVETSATGVSNIYNLDDQVVESVNDPYIFGSALTDTYHRTLSGNTAARPAAGKNLTSYMTYFDTDVGNPVWYDGSSWIDAFGGAPATAYITASSTDTLTNKTFDANGTGNSLSNVDVADLANGTDGELITWSSSAAPATVAVGTATHVLTSNGVGAAPTFQASSGSDLVNDTTPQLGGQLDVNGNAIGDGTLELITFTEDASAVNQVNIENEATGSGPIISAAGGDTNIDLNLNGKATGNVILRDGTDVTKDVSFEISGSTTGKTSTLTFAHTDDRTLTMPDRTCSILGDSSVHTLTNKTMTGTGNAFSGIAFSSLDTTTTGFVVGAPTGGDKGAGTINASAVYDDNVILTCYVFDQAVDGNIDNSKWDAKVGAVGTHKPMRKFKDRIGTKYDPLDIDKYTQHFKDKKHLTSMPNEVKFNVEEGMPTGEWIQRLIETVEIQAVHISQLNDRLKVMEGEK